MKKPLHAASPLPGHGERVSVRDTRSSSEQRPLTQGTVLALLLFLVLACRERTRPPVILISIDTLRSDHLPAYGYRNVQTAAIDSLAADGIVFENAWAHVPLTLPSHASVMTGLLPPEHGVRDNAGYRLDTSTPTIASLLRANGYATGAAVSAYVLRGSTGMSAGFDAYDDRIPFIEGAPAGNLQRGGRDTIAAARQWLDATAGKPFFLFVHLFEPHAPYEPTYDADVARSDEAVGALLDALREKEIYDDALIVLLSDHGEGLRDHGEQEHGVLLYREALQVPLIVKLPRGERKGTRVPALAQLIDVLPTVAEITRITPPANLRGQSLRSDLGERTSYAETLYPRIHLGWSDLRSAVRWPFHLIDGPKPELYRTATDRAERNDVLQGERRALVRLRTDLAAIPQPATTAPRVDAEEAKKLAALGYVSAGASRPSSLNPRDHLRDLDELKTVTELMAGKKYDDAIARIEALLARNPGWSDLRDELGVAYEASGDLAGAERVYRAAIATTPELAHDFALSLAAVLLAQGRHDEAEQHARVALHSNPPAAHHRLGEIALARGDVDRAEAEAREARKAPAVELHADFLLARVLIARRDLAGAIALLQKMRERRLPLPPRYYFVAGDALARAGRLPEARDAFERQIAIEPRDRDAWVALAMVHRIGGDTAAAQATLQRMVEANPDAQTRELARRRAQDLR